MRRRAGAWSGKTFEVPSVPFRAWILGHGFRGCCCWESASQFGGRAGISSAASTAQRR